MLHRTPSEAGASSANPATRWRFGSALKRMQSRTNNREDKNWTHRLHSASTESDHHEPSLHLRQADTHSLHENPDSSYRQLQSLVQRMRSAPSGPSHVDASYKEFTKIKDRCAQLCTAILQEEIRPIRHSSNATETLERRDSSVESPRSPGPLFDHRSSFSGRSLAEVMTSSTTGRPGPPQGNEVWLGVVRDWKTCIENLTEAFKTSLAETYRSYEKEATPEMIDALFSSKKFRREAVHRMRNASVTRVLSADPQFFPRYEIRFRNYEKIKQELAEIRSLLQSGESGISPARPVEEFLINARGDAILEFANLSADSTGNEAVLRFRVSSYMLAETSPIFARMFSGHSSSLHLHEAEDITDQLPPPAIRYVCKDGTEAKLYRMPQHEVNHLSALEILLHAAHMHNEVVPREVSFEQFVAIAECSMRYKSTSPLELVVEHRWLPQWMHKGADDMPDGLLIISYAFGLRQLFTRMSKSAILNLVDEQDLQRKPWPQKIKDKIWAVRCAKVAQVHDCCTGTIQEYIRHPSRDLSQMTDPVAPSDLRSTMQTAVTPPNHITSLTSTPRCPKGSHSCDALNLGWMMMVFNEMNLLSHVVRPRVLWHLPDSQIASGSLVQLVETLRGLPSPAAPIHRGGVCDPGPAFRAAVADIYNSIAGLTLFDISGKSHGWALSKHRMSEPQMLMMSGLSRMAGDDHGHSVVTEFSENVMLHIMGQIDNLDDLHAAARINRAFYETYKRNELLLMRNILRADRARSGTLRQPLRASNAEGKVLKSESDKLKEGGAERPDSETLGTDSEESSDSDGEDYDDEDESLYAPPSPPEYSMSASDDNRHGSGSTATHASTTAPRNASGRPRQDSHSSSAPSATEDREPTDRSPGGTTSPTTPRQVVFDSLIQRRPSPEKPSVILTEDIDEPPLTDEEARRILWPDPVSPVVSPIIRPPPAVEGLREKFRVGDPSFAEGLEEKTLVIVGEKQLRSEHDRQVGLRKDGARPGSSKGKAGQGGSKGK